MEGVVPESKPRVCFEFEVEKVIAISSDGSYQVQWAPAWVSRFHLVGCEHLIQEFLHHHQQQQQRQQLQQQQQSDDVKTESLPGNLLEESNVSGGISSCGDKLEKFPNKQESVEVKHEPEDMTIERNILSEDSRYTVPDELGNTDPTQPTSQWINFAQEKATWVASTSHSIFHSSILEASSSTDVNNYPNQPQSFIPINNNGSIEETRTESHPTYNVDRATSLTITAPKPFMATNHDEHHYACALCPAKFKNQGNLSCHLRNHNTKRQFSCSECTYSSSTKSNLKLHMHTHRGELPYRCDVCGQSFPQSSVLRQHLRTHTHDEPLECGHCGKLFLQKTNLNTHMTSMH